MRLAIRIAATPGFHWGNVWMYWLKLMGAALALSMATSVAATAQHDTTHHMTPGMKMPSASKKPAASPKTTNATKKARAKTTRAARSKTAAHVHDTTHAQARDT